MVARKRGKHGSRDRFSRVVVVVAWLVGCSASDRAQPAPRAPATTDGSDASADGAMSTGDAAPADAADASIGATLTEAGASTGPADAASTQGRADGSDAATTSSSTPLGTQEMFLWAGVAPGSEGATFTETITQRSVEAGVSDRSITTVSRPSMFPFPAANPNGAAAIIMPGGGYTHLTVDKEGTDIAAWLNSLGVTAFVLKYRLPVDFPGAPWIPLADAQRAIRIVRQNALAWSIDSTRIGVVGFSAGGHLASQLETRFASPATPALDAVDALDARPSFSVLMYPVISMDATIAHAPSRLALLGNSPTPALIALYSSELQVTSTTPATFIGVSSKDTTVNPQNSVVFDTALKTAGVREEFHLYQDGAHGVGIRDATGDMAAWPTQCAAWMKAIGVLP